MTVPPQSELCRMGRPSVGRLQRAIRFQVKDKFGKVSIVDEPRHLQGFHVRAMNEDAIIADAASAADMAEIRAMFVKYQQWLGRLSKKSV